MFCTKVHNNTSCTVTLNMPSLNHHIMQLLTGMIGELYYLI